jgi:hypothetical protein
LRETIITPTNKKTIEFAMWAKNSQYSFIVIRVSFESLYLP